METLLLTPAMVKKETQLGRGATYALVNSLPMVRQGRRILTPRAALVAWIEANTELPSGSAEKA